MSGSAFSSTLRDLKTSLESLLTILIVEKIYSIDAVIILELLFKLDSFRFMTVVNSHELNDLYLNPLSVSVALI